ncbi:ATP-dependent DNA ligase [Pararhodonellum marinum]|uniref:ATP-dependent DNA ligase n=1 Tax=Pararhodonellum marinum TaxID=2755358 RepID=UPI00188E589C|nr:ATP-dependent DNA ligase [Pararhodonellum marinum]
MRAFADLFSRLDQSNKLTDKLYALGDFFEKSTSKDRLWTLAIFTHKRPKRQVNTRKLREWCTELAQIPDWLFEECYQKVGDLAETIALLLPPAKMKNDFPLHHWIDFLIALETKTEEEKKVEILAAWNQMDQAERLVFNKLITGGFRIGVSQQVITRAVAETFGMEKNEVAHRIMGNWHPDQITFEELILSDQPADDASRPYPFYLSYPLEEEPQQLGRLTDWIIEWKWDGIRGQIIKRKGQTYIWSRGEELVNDKFPELVELGNELPDGTVLDGEIIPFQNGKPLPFNLLQTRIGRKNLTKKILQEVPIHFIAYDIMEAEQQDIRSIPQRERRKILENIHAQLERPNFHLSQIILAPDWEQLQILRQEAREKMAEGFMLKNKKATYEVGRKKGNWWKWKIAPLVIDGVLLYAQKGHGRRADLYTDYTLAVWDGDLLVPFAKAYSGLTDAEINQVDRFVKQNTKERFGPVRTVKPELVFEIAFEGIQSSPRHKSGIALRFPRINRWRKDKKMEEANTLDDLKAFLALYES